MKCLTFYEKAVISVFIFDNFQKFYATKQKERPEPISYH